MLMSNTLQKATAIYDALLEQLEICLLIQLQGGNNLADLTPKTVWVEKLGTFFLIKTWDCFIIT